MKFREEFFGGSSVIQLPSSSRDVKVSFQDIIIMRKKLEMLYEGRVNQAFVERVLILYLLFGDSVCPA